MVAAVAAGEAPGLALSGGEGGNQPARGEAEPDQGFETTPEQLAEYRRRHLFWKEWSPSLAGALDEEMLHWMDVDLERDFAGYRVWLDYAAKAYCQANVAGQRADFGFTQHDLVVRSPKTWFHIGGATLKLRALDVHPRPRLPDTGRRFPRRLYNIQVGANFIWALPPGAYNVTIGSASDRPFDSDDEITVDATWAMGCPVDDDGWVVFLNWQNNRDYLNRAPMPGFVWRRKEGKWLTLALGFPANAVAWRPTNRLELAASYIFPRTVYSQVRYRLWKGLRLYGGLDWASQRYFRHDRLRSRDRLWYLEKRLSLGLRWEVSENLFFDLGGGYAFDRFWFEGETYEDRGYNRLNIADGPFVSFQLGARF